MLFPKFIRLFDYFHFKCHFARITFNFAQRLNNSTSSARYLISRRKNLLFASLAGFSFKALGISDEELAEFHISNGHDPFNAPEKTEDWENIYADQRITVYRRKMNGKGIYEYRCIGSYPDISADDFIQAQFDVEYRQRWDENIKSIEVLEEESASGSQVIRWETKYPYPMNPRLYIYVQRKTMDSTGKVLTVVNRAIDEEAYPDKSQEQAKKNSSSVRVTEYSSKLLVRAHTEMDKKGLDFVLIYHDDPKAPIPKKVYEFGVNVVGPKFLTEVHNAAKKLAEEREKSEATAAAIEKEKAEQTQTSEETAVQQQVSTTTTAPKEPETEKEEEGGMMKKEEKTTKEIPPAAEEAEEEIMDPIARWRAKCEQEKVAQELKVVLQRCNERVQMEGSQESCHMEMVDWVHAVDHCAMPKAFRELK